MIHHGKSSHSNIGNFGMSNDNSMYCIKCQEFNVDDVVFHVYLFVSNLRSLNLDEDVTV